MGLLIGNNTGQGTPLKRGYRYLHTNDLTYLYPGHKYDDFSKANGPIEKNDIDLFSRYGAYRKTNPNGVTVDVYAKNNGLVYKPNKYTFLQEEATFSGPKSRAETFIKDDRPDYMLDFDTNVPVYDDTMTKRNRLLIK